MEELNSNNPLVARISLRFMPDEPRPPVEVIEEYLRTVQDRLLIRLDTEEVPERGFSIVVDATMKALRLRGFEGSRSESLADGGSFSNSFIDDVLDAYSAEIAALKKVEHKVGVKFI